MKKPQLITIVVAVLLVSGIYIFGRTVPKNNPVTVEENHEGHNHGDDLAGELTTDSIMLLAKKELNPDQLTRVIGLENAVSRGDVKAQSLRVYRQLSQFWKDTMHFFPPYAWYQAEAARLENSEKSLTFAAHLFLNTLQTEHNPGLQKWSALQAKDLFERSLKLNPTNDSAKVGLGATYLFGNISPMPMTGIRMIQEVENRDSSNVYAIMTLAKGSVLSGQFDKAIPRLVRINKLQPNNLDAMLMLAELFEKTEEKTKAIEWYRKSIPYSPSELVPEIEKRIAELRK